MRDKKEIRGGRGRSESYKNRKEKPQTTGGGQPLKMKENMLFATTERKGKRRVKQIRLKQKKCF